MEARPERVRLGPSPVGDRCCLAHQGAMPKNSDGDVSGRSEKIDERLVKRRDHRLKMSLSVVAGKRMNIVR